MSPSINDVFNHMQSLGVPGERVMFTSNYTSEVRYVTVLVFSPVLRFEAVGVEKRLCPRVTSLLLLSLFFRRIWPLRSTRA